MFTSDQYQLLDFGGGRKLERFGAYMLDRPAPAARDGGRRAAALWEQADAKFERGNGNSGRWVFARSAAPAWTVRHDAQSLELKFSSYGQVGLFPEQADNWDWIADQVRCAPVALKVLNLFGYTGASTLAAAAAGAEVTHVDAASSVVAWAQRNARASRLADAPIRWITEDAGRFVRRELRRKQRYGGIILDPPAYGHGPGGEVWKLEDNLAELLDDCLKLLGDEGQFLLLTCHSGEWAFSTPLLKAVVGNHPALRSSGKITGSDMLTTSAAGGRMHCGAAVRWMASGVGMSAQAERRGPGARGRQ